MLYVLLTNLLLYKIQRKCCFDFAGIKEYSNWPTIPQVFIDGEFVGGCDLMLEMHKNGELIDELQKVGIRSALLDKKDELS